MKPKVSIIMATYNRAHFIIESLISIQNQTFRDWECIIVDDGSTDDTSETITPILKQDIRFKYVIRPDRYKKALPGCRNYGLDLAKGDYIIFFDDDDIVHPQNLELCVLELEDTAISFCRYMREVFFDDFGYDFDYSKQYSSFYIDLKDIEKILKNELQFNSTSVMWRKECFENTRYVEKLMYCEEWELYSRIISSGIKGVSIEKCLYYGRKHNNSMTGEFYNNNPILRRSNAEAILLVLQNLKKKKMLSYSLIRYFIAFSIDFKEYNLYEKILNILDLSIFEKLKWRFFYFVLPFRMMIYRVNKIIKRKVY